MKSQSSFAKQIQNSWHILTNRNPAVWLSINIFTDSRNFLFWILRLIGISVNSEFQCSNQTPPGRFVHKTIFQIRTCEQIGGFANRISIPRFFILRSPLVFLRVEMKFLTSLFTTRQNTPLLSCVRLQPNFDKQEICKICISLEFLYSF